MADPRISQQQIDDLKELHKLLEKQPKFLRGLTGLWDSIKINIKDSESHVDHLSKGSKDFLDISKKVLSNTKDIHKETVDWADISKEILKAQYDGNYHLADQFKQYKKIQQGQKRYNNLVNAGANSISKMVGNLDSGIRNIPFIGDFLADAINFDDMSKEFTGSFREAAAVGGPAGEAISSGMRDNVSQGVVEGLSSGFAEEGKWGTRIVKWFKDMPVHKGKKGFTIDHTDLDIMKAHNKKSRSYQSAAKRFGVENLSRKQAIEKVEKGSVRKLSAMRVATVGIGIGLMKMATTMASFAFETGLGLNQMWNMGPALLINKRYVEAMAEEFGTINDVNAKTAWTLKKQQWTYGIQADQAVKILRIQTAISDKTSSQLIDIQNMVADAARLAGVLPAKVFEDIAQNMEFFAKYAVEGGKAVMDTAVEAKKLGLNLGVVDQITTHLLDIEGSINAQFEASAVLGREINVDRARQLALTGQHTLLLEEIIKQVGTEAQFNSYNVVQRDLLSKAIGTDVQSLAKLVTTQKESTKAAEKVQSQYRNLAIIIGGVVGLIAGALIGSGFGSKVGLSMLTGAGIGTISGMAIGAGIGMNLPKFHTMPQGTGVQITKGDAAITAGETTFKSVDVNKGQNEVIEETKRTNTILEQGLTKLNNSIQELG
jgi:hypothetical protein